MPGKIKLKDDTPKQDELFRGIIASWSEIHLSRSVLCIIEQVRYPPVSAIHSHTEQNSRHIDEKAQLRQINIIESSANYSTIY